MNQKNKIVLLHLTLVFGIFVNEMAHESSGDEVIYAAGKVLTMTGATLSPGQVLVVDGKIQDVAQSIVAGSDVKRIDLGKKSVLMPGMINAYTQAALVDDSSNEMTREVTPSFAAIRGIDWKSLEMRKQLESGTTTVCIAPGTENVISGIASLVKTGGNEPTKRIINPDGPLVASLCSDPSQRNRARQRPDGIYVRQPTNRMGVVWLLRTNFDKARSGNDVSLRPVKEALNDDRMIFVVSRTSYDLNTVLTIAQEFDFAPIIVGGQESYKMADALAAKKIPVILGALTSGSQTGPEDSELCWNQAGVLSDAGVSISFTGDDLLKQARFAHRFGMPKEDALAAVTTTPAKLLGINDRVGGIAPGMDADMIALDGEPFELTSAIRWVMVDGEIIELNKE